MAELYASYMPALKAASADWVLRADSKDLPVHSKLLCSLSPVLAGLEGTKPDGDGKVLVPFSRGVEVAVKFLQWAYTRGPLDLTILEAQELALLSHEWNIAGKDLISCGSFSTSTRNLLKLATALRALVVCPVKEMHQRIIWIVSQVSQTHATETLPAISLVETC